MESQAPAGRGHARRRRDILLGATGSVGIVKLPQLALELHDLSYSVTIVLTKSAEFFFYGDHDGSCRRYDELRYAKLLNLINEGVIDVVKERDEWDCLLTSAPHAVAGSGAFATRAAGDILIVALLLACTIAFCADSLSKESKQAALGVLGMCLGYFLSMSSSTSSSSSSSWSWSSWSWSWSWSSSSSSSPKLSNRVGSFSCPVLHIELRDAHKLLVIAPLSANSLAK